MSARFFVSAGTLAMLALTLSPVIACAQDWDDLVRQAAERNAIPATWVRAVLQAESAGDPHAVSGAGAMGLMQLMPGTWKEVRRTLSLGADPFDPHDNIVAGAAYLRWLHDRYGDAGFLAAYNAGPARYDDHLATGRPLPGETVSYVAQVRNLIENPDAFLPGSASQTVSDWRAGSLFVVEKKLAEPTTLAPVSRRKYVPAFSLFPAGFFPSPGGIPHPDFFVSRVVVGAGAIMQDGIGKP
ncbi:lytic transglycosylase domain-containing protein [Acetobacter okinawensis]|uniref:lytic transglycosylase domain-containing protein n=1 Tax=Acetobacter okinawensis TaxID=1076594 RepID=UPI002012E80B|nr:lytic transglycosylase domain-containing protein [Acetobacter okinawensis]